MKRALTGVMYEDRSNDKKQTQDDLIPIPSLTQSIDNDKLMPIPSLGTSFSAEHKVENG